MKLYITSVCLLLGLFFFLIAALAEPLNWKIDSAQFIDIFGDNLAMKLYLAPICVLLGLSCCLIPTFASAQSIDTFPNDIDNPNVLNQAAAGDTTGLLNLINQK